MRGSSCDSRSLDLTGRPAYRRGAQEFDSQNFTLLISLRLSQPATLMSTILRKGHFLGAKLRALRKRNGLTLEEVSARCIQRDAELAPSVSYLSMIESSKRVPSPELLKLLAAVFQRDASWFLDENADVGAERAEARRGGAERVPLEPAFLFAKDVLQAAIPELLAQTGTT